MPEITYNEHTIEHGSSTSSASVRKALSVAEKKSIDAAAEKTGLPSRLIEKWCDEADVEPGSGRIAGGDGAPATLGAKDAGGSIEFFEPAREAAVRQGGAFLAIYKGSAGGFRFSTAAAALMGFEDGDRIVFARGTGEERTHVYLGVKKDGRKPAGGKGAKISVTQSARGFNSVALAQMLGISKPEEGRRLTIETEPVKKKGLDLWKAVLQEPEESDD